MSNVPTPEAISSSSWVIQHRPQSAAPMAWLDILDDCDVRAARERTTDAARHRFLERRVLLRRALSAMTQVPVAPHAWRFERLETGQFALAPRFRNCGLRFSLADAGTVSLVSVAHNGAIGADIEKISQPHVRYSDIAAALSPREEEHFKNDATASLTSDHLKIWSIKEAYSKQLGRGCDLDFADLEVTLDPPSVAGSMAQVTTREICIGTETYFVAVASAGATAAPSPTHPVTFLRSLEDSNAP